MIDDDEVDVMRIQLQHFGESARHAFAADHVVVLIHKNDDEYSNDYMALDGEPRQCVRMLGRALVEMCASVGMTKEGTVEVIAEVIGNELNQTDRVCRWVSEGGKQCEQIISQE